MSTLPEKGQNRPDPVAYGRSLTSGIGVNLLVRDIAQMSTFLSEVLAMEIVYWDDDFALCHGYGGQLMLHHDRTYSRHPFVGSVAGTTHRGAGVEIRLYGCDPDKAVERAEHCSIEDIAVLDAPAFKPHGVREAFIVGPEGYVFAPTVPASADG